jgi:phosphoglycolate phosphatase-like HAD superfamily hydrolase
MVLLTGIKHVARLRFYVQIGFEAGIKIRFVARRCSSDLLMNLVIFDIDDTLTETMQVDTACFVQSFADVFGFDGINADWSQYPHTTDSGIFRDIYTERIGRPPQPAEIARFQQHFISLLTAASRQSPFKQVSGAKRLLTRIAQAGTHQIALATGAWRDSARLKMASAGLCYDDHPAASADDAVERISIMRLSLQRAVERHKAGFKSVVYVGDGVWDARACRALGIPFVGIGSGVRATQLVAEGAFRLFKDYSEDDMFLETLAELTGIAQNNLPQFHRELSQGGR